MPLKLLAVNGSLREKSFGMLSLNILLEAAGEHGAEVRILDLKKANLPMFDPDAGGNDPRVAGVLEQVKWAEAFALSSPDYHGSMSGALKNFLDFHWREFSGKLFAYLCASEEKGLTVMEQMRTAVRQCYGWSLPYNVSIHGHQDFDAAGNITSAPLRNRLRMTARDLITYGQLLRTQFANDSKAGIKETFAAKYGS